MSGLSPAVRENQDPAPLGLQSLLVVTSNPAFHQHEAILEIFPNCLGRPTRNPSIEGPYGRPGFAETYGRRKPGWLGPPTEKTRECHGALTERDSLLIDPGGAV